MVRRGAPADPLRVQPGIDEDVEVAQLHEVRVLQTLQRAKLLLDVEDGAGVEATQRLQRHVRAVLAIDRLVDDPHAARPEAPHDLEAGRPAEIPLVSLHRIERTRLSPPPLSRNCAGGTR